MYVNLKVMKLEAYICIQRFPIPFAVGDKYL